MKLIIITIVCLCYTSCNPSCRNFNFAKELKESFTPKICFSNSECCKKWLLQKLQNNSSSEISLILYRISYFPEIDYKTIEDNLKKNRLYKQFEDNITLNSNFFYDTPKSVEIYPTFLSGLEKEIMKNILHDSVFTSKKEPQLLIKKNNKIYLFVQKNWYRLVNDYKNIPEFFLINLNDIIFNEKKDRILIEAMHYRGVKHYIFELKDGTWNISFSKGLKF